MSQFSKKYLDERWKTEDGQERLAEVVEALKKKEHWVYIIEDFPGVYELKYGRDLRGADLRNAHFEGAELKSAHLEGAKLGGAHLEGAELGGAHLEGAELGGAHLEGAKLQGAHLEYARLWDSHLEGADLRSAHLEGAELWSAHLEGADLRSAHLEGADLRRAHLEGAELLGAHLEGAKLRRAHLEGVELGVAHLEGADLWSAHLEGAELENANLQGAKITNCNLTGAEFFDVKINNKTDFRGSNIESMLCTHETLNQIKYNNRRLNWEDWYDKNRLGWMMVRPFWWLTDYGTDQKNLIKAFFIGALLFALFFWAFPSEISGLASVENTEWMPIQFETIQLGLLGDLSVPVEYRAVVIETKVPSWLIPFRALYFSVVTMTTLGFGDIYASPTSIWGHLVLVLQVLLGYVLLGAMITRLGILFQSGGPTDIKK